MAAYIEPRTTTLRKPRFSLGACFGHDSPIMRFWRWWSAELSELVPQWLRQSGDLHNKLFIEVGKRATVIHRWQQGEFSELGRLDEPPRDVVIQSVPFQALLAKLRKRNDRIVLWLPDPQCLVRQISLPLAAAENLREVLGFEMDRHTPFKVDQVYFDFRIVRRDPQKGRLAVQMVLAPRVAVDSALDFLVGVGAPATGIAMKEPSINLMPPERRVGNTSLQQRINVAMLATVVVLALTAVFLPLWQKHEAMQNLLPQVDNAKRQAGAASGLRQELEQLVAVNNYLLEKKRVRTSTLALFNELARILPEDTWVRQLDLRGRELQIIGETASSSKLIALFDGSPKFEKARYRSKLTKGMALKGESYHIEAQLKEIPMAASAHPVAAAALQGQKR